jgi:hypothetical protein
MAHVGQKSQIGAGSAELSNVTVKLFPNAVGGLGHEGIGVNTNDTQGFYPARTNDPGTQALEALGLSVPGAVYKDAMKEPNQASQSITIRTSADQDRRMQAAIDARIKTPGFYKFVARNCAGFVRDVLSAGGVPAPSRAEPTAQFGALREFFPSNPVMTTIPRAAGQ